MHTRVHVCPYIHKYRCMHMHTHTCTCTHTHAHACICTCAHVTITEMHASTCTHKQTNTHRHDGSFQCYIVNKCGNYQNEILMFMSDVDRKHSNINHLEVTSEANHKINS